MTINSVVNICEQELKKAGVKYEKKEAITSTSVYFRIELSNSSLLFRIANHSTYKDVITLRVDHKIRDEYVRNFVKNRISDARKRNLKNILGISYGKVKTAH